MQIQRDFLESLVKSGIHWGHQRSRRNPKMEPYIWGNKSNISLIDVSKTARGLEAAAKFLHDIASEGKTILWVGTKKPAQKAVESIAQSLHMPYVTHRWIGGTLSNFGQVKKSVTKLLHFEDVLSKSDKFPHYTKKEINVINKNTDRLQKNVGGIRTLKWPIGALVIVDILKERSALKEAAQMGIPVVALVDTNADPTLVNYVIPGNDDAPKAISFVVNFLAASVEKGAKKAKAIKKEQEEAKEQEDTRQVDLALMETDEEEDKGSKRKGKAIPAKSEGKSSGPRGSAASKSRSSRPRVTSKKNDFK